MLVHRIFIFNDIHVIVFDLCITLELDCILGNHQALLRQVFVFVTSSSLYRSKVGDLLLHHHCSFLVQLELVASIEVIGGRVLHLG